jgi:superfamily II DNA or RNA helicase
MTTVIKVHKLNDVHLYIEAEASIKEEISDRFSFLIPDAKWHPLVKAKIWDGVFRIFQVKDSLLYVGLLRELANFCRDNEYHLELMFEYHETAYSLFEANKFFDSLNSGKESRDYQIEAFAHIVRRKRGLLLSPTSSGKSFLLYMIVKYFDVQTLMILPRLGLTKQMYQDFIDYGADPKDIQVICGDLPKKIKRKYIFALWQSIQKQPKEWFLPFQAVLVDEAHGAKAKVITDIMCKLEQCPVRVGVTGTLDGTTLNKLILEGLFGPVKQVTTTRKLMDQGHVAKLKIKAIVLKYPEAFRKQFHDKENPTDFAAEKKFLITCASRNRFLSNLLLSLKGNTLMMFQNVEHGDLLYDISSGKGKKILLSHGGVDVEIREKIRQSIELEDNLGILGSYGTFGMGTNMVNLRNIIFGSSFKAPIPVLQGIGRVLRKSFKKKDGTLFDIGDDISWKSKKNSSFKHFEERLEIYKKEGFNVEVYEVKLDFPQ